VCVCVCASRPLPPRAVEVYDCVLREAQLMYSFHYRRLSAHPPQRLSVRVSLSSYYVRDASSAAVERSTRHALLRTLWCDHCLPAMIPVFV